MPINKKWLEAVAEETIEPDLQICDPHHHLWKHPNSTYLTQEFLEDTSSGHKIASTVFVECMSEYYTESPKPLAPVGETEFVEKLANKNIAENTEIHIAEVM